MRYRKFFLIAASTAALTASQSAMAAGFAVSAQAAYGLGNAYAGNAAVAADASTVQSNPAGIFELDEALFSVSVALTAGATDFTDEGSRISPLFGSDLINVTGSRDSDFDGVRAAPNLYYARKFSDNWAFGLGINVPFATASEYDDDWIGRYHAVETEVTAIDINPSIAYRINDRISVAGGISLQVANALLTNKLDSGATCELVVLQSGAPAGTCASIGLTPNDPTVDSNVELDGDGTAFSFNLGALFKPVEGTKIGLHYRNGADHDLEGDTTFDVNPALAGLIGAGPPGPQFLDNSGSSLSADLPATLDISIAQRVHSQVELLGTVLFTQWSSFDNLVTTFDNPAQPDSNLPFDWQNSFSASFGANFDVNDRLQVRAGLQFDETPIPDEQARSARGPTGDRFWYSIGASYRFTKNISATFGYTRLEIEETGINNTPPATGSPTLRGQYDFDVNLLAFQFNWHFI